jgi:hypothetical protein
MKEGAMSGKRVLNVPKARQEALARQFPWLMGVDLNAKRDEVQLLSVSVFDHWLSEEEGSAQLENVPAQEQARRDALLAGFCARVTEATEVLSFVQRGRQDRRILFRSFASAAARSAYCRPNGGKTLGHAHFHVVLPELDCAFYESWDDTYHFFFTTPTVVEAARGWAEQSGVFLISE